MAQFHPPLGDRWAPLYRRATEDDPKCVEICYTYLNRIVPKCVHILADSSNNKMILNDLKVSCCLIPTFQQAVNA